MRILVTGGSGFTGRHVLPLLVKEGHDVVALARSEESARAVAALGAEAVAGNLDDPESVDVAMATTSPDALINIASLGFGHAPTIVAAAEDNGVRRAVFVSTTAIFTSLPAPSKRTRLAAEDAVRRSALDWTILRPTMIYGAPGDRNLSRLLRLLRWAPVIPVPGGGHRLQQPVHVQDLAEAIVAAIGTDATIGRAYDVAGPEALPLRDVIGAAACAVGRSPRLVSTPLGPTIAALRGYERLAKQPRLKAEQLERLAEDKAFDISAARLDLGFDPRPFAVGIAEEAGLL